MKRILCLVLGCLFGLMAQATPSTVNASIQYTPGAASYAGSNSAAATLVNNCIATINSSYTAQGINVAIAAYVSPAGGGVLPDTYSPQFQFAWAQSSIPSLLFRNTTASSMAIIVSAPGTGVQGVIPAAPPTQARDSVGAVNVDGASLCNQLEQAISRNLGASQSQGVGQRVRLLPYETGGLVGATLCYRTKDAAPTTDSQLWPQVPYYNNVDSGGHETNSATRAEDPEQVCKNFLTVFSPPAYDPGETYTFTTPAPYGCRFYHAPPPTPGTWNGDVGPIVSITPTGGSTTISCTNPEVVVNRYSQTGTVYHFSGGYGHDFATGNATHDNVAAMNASVSMVQAFSGSNAKLLAAAHGLFDTIVSLLLFH